MLPNSRVSIVCLEACQLGQHYYWYDFTLLPDQWSCCFQKVLFALCALNALTTTVCLVAAALRYLQIFASRRPCIVSVWKPCAVSLPRCPSLLCDPLLFSWHALWLGRIPDVCRRSGRARTDSRPRWLHTTRASPILLCHILLLYTAAEPQVPFLSLLGSPWYGPRSDLCGLQNAQPELHFFSKIQTDCPGGLFSSLLFLSDKPEGSKDKSNLDPEIYFFNFH